MPSAALVGAKNRKNDEFYTRYEDIQVELNHYREQFKDKIIYCNCDDPGESNFSRFFMLNFEYFGLKKLICTHYINSNLFEWLEDRRKGYMLEITGKDQVKKTYLNGNGDFRSEECVELLKTADIICTNPPFSLFREYVAQLIHYDKKFLIIGNKNSITYKEIFPFIKENKIWLGYTTPMDFLTPSGKESGKMAGLTRWFTNLDTTKRHEKIVLYEKYDSLKNPGYDNYEAIDVSKTTEIPCDYYGVMGVPISFFDRYNPEQFEILECHEPAIALSKAKMRPGFKEYKSRQINVNGKLCQKTYHRIFIKRKDSNEIN